jgi:hypothetical protein
MKASYPTPITIVDATLKPREFMFARIGAGINIAFAWNLQVFARNGNRSSSCVLERALRTTLALIFELDLGISSLYQTFVFIREGSK